MQGDNQSESEVRHSVCSAQPAARHGDQTEKTAPLLRQCQQGTCCIISGSSLSSRPT